MRRKLLLLICTGSYFFSIPQTVRYDKYPQGFFYNPLNIPIQLTANYGELRPHHWHMGLDIRTDQKQNLPVKAAAEGYISKVKIEPLGFGRALYINHPNGLTTLYAHLNDFFPELERYVTIEQYKMESWQMDLDLPKDLFPVSKGQLIGYSGNTGASHGPHLHFEIRDTKTEKCLNPLLFGFPIQDDVPPALIRLALYDRSMSVFEQTPELFPLKKTDSGYIISSLPVIITPLKKLSFAIQAYDRQSSSSNDNGIYGANLYFDSSSVIEFVLDSIDYYETRWMDAHIDYRHKYNGGAYLQHLSKLPGNNSSVYRSIKTDGIIQLDDTIFHAVRIEVKDEYSNSSELNFKIQHSDSLRKLTNAILTGVAFYPRNVNVFEQPDFQAFTIDDATIDTTHISYFKNSQQVPNAVSANHSIGDASTPLFSGLNVSIKPFVDISDELKDKIVIRRNAGGLGNVKKPEWHNGWLTANFDEFGSFQAFIDTIPPQLTELGKKDTADLSAETSIVFQPTDNFGIKSFSAELDGSWLRFTNDKRWSYIYKFDERCPYGIHELKVKVEDLVGNTFTKTWWFKRYPYTAPKKKIIKKVRNKKKRKYSKK